MLAKTFQVTAPDFTSLRSEPIQMTTTRQTSNNMSTNLQMEAPRALQQKEKSTSLFLNLPFRVRVQIYWYAGNLACPRYRKFINLSNPGAPDRNHDRQRFINTFRLLLTCKTIYRELSRLVYSLHHFFAGPDLGVLRRLRPESLAALRWLTVHVNVSTCGLGGLCSGYLYPWMRTSDSDYEERPLSLSIADNRQLIQEWLCLWKDVIRPILSQEQRLTLNFVCDVADLKTGLEVVRPLLSEQAPILKGCSLRISHKRDGGLQELACRTVEALTGRSITQHNTEHQHFRFLDLPAELRYKILSYTDLVTPLREVEWNPRHGMYFRYKFIGSRPRLPCYAHGYPAWSTDQSWKAARSSYLGCWEKSLPAGCFCRAYHAAESTVFQCACWAPPTAFFLVNREVRLDALQVFFTQSRFVVTPAGGVTWTGVDDPPDRLPISVFLSNIVPTNGLRYLRFLEIVFPPFGVHEACEYCPARSLQWHHWVQALEKVKEHLDLPKLTIRVYFADWLPEDPTKPIPSYRSSINGEQCAAIWDIYRDITSPLKSLKGLARFFVHVWDPTAWVEENRPELPSLEDLEQEIERSVMGEDYDSNTAGKTNVRDSRWLEDDERHGLFGASID